MNSYDFLVTRVPSIYIESLSIYLLAFYQYTWVYATHHRRSNLGLKKKGEKKRFLFFLTDSNIHTH